MTETTPTSKAEARLVRENQRLRTELSDLRKQSRQQIRELELRIKSFHIQDFEDARAEVAALREELAEIRRKARAL